MNTTTNTNMSLNKNDNMTIEFGADDISKPNFFAEGVKYVYNKNKKKSLSDWIDEFCKTICIDYDLFSQPIVEADEEVEIEETEKPKQKKLKSENQKIQDILAQNIVF